MSSEPTVTICGNITAAPEVRFTQAGRAVANFSIAATPRTFDKTTDSWVDGETLFLRCTVWGHLAENAAASLPKGAGVVATGRLSQSSYESSTGEKRVSIELQVEDVGPSLRNSTAVVTRNPKKPSA